MRKIGLLFLLLTQLAFAQMTIDVMSYNIRMACVDDGENHWNIRKEQLRDLVYYYQADFVGLQEAQKPQIDFLLANGEYAVVGKPRSNDDNAEYSCILYRKDLYKVLEESTFWLSETPDTPGKSWDAAYPRIVTYALFQNIKNKKKLWVLNTHLDHIGIEARQKSVILIMDKIKTLQSKRNVPVVLTGDFNSQKTDAWMKPLLENLQEASGASITKPYGGLPTWNAFKFLEKPKEQIDFIFTSKQNVLVKKYRTITDFYEFKYPSDHFPIVARIELR